MGCVESGVVVNSDTLKTQIKRVKLYCDPLKQRIDKELKNAERLLIDQVVKEKRQRNKQLQRAMIRGNVRFFNKKLIYCYIENEANMVLQHINFLTVQNQLINIKGSLNILQYCSKFMSFQDLSKFESMLRSRFPNFLFPSDNDISNQIIKSEKLGQPVFKSQIDYIFQFSLNYQIPMEKINQAGHNYRFGAEKYEG